MNDGQTMKIRPKLDNSIADKNGYSFFCKGAANTTPQTQTHTDWGKSLILDAMHTPPFSLHTGKFSMPPRLRQKMRLLYLNDYGNGKHAAGPL